MNLGGYHIIFVPRDPKKTRRFHFSSFSARIVALCSVLVVPIVVGCLFAAVHYQNRIIALKSQMAEEHQLLEQKEVLITKLSSIERSLSNAEDSVKNLEQKLDLETGNLTGGLGPFEKDREYAHLEGGLDHTEPLLNTVAEGKPVGLKKVRDKMNEVSTRISNLLAKSQEIYEINQDKIRFFQSTPNSMPVNGWITSGFGFRKSPVSSIFKMHYGIDVASPIGTGIQASADGKVLVAEYEGGYGNKVVLEHDYGITTVYGHASKLYVKAGDKVKKGDVIAAVGSTGSSTGPHVHYEVYVDGIPTDPLNYIVK
ncbi:peptidoglycan DD-metalloendopeptidase family protein [bacterium]|nr:peptidoglycan DD-metalloendopeptidase family protein [bacterium]